MNTVLRKMITLGLAFGAGAAVGYTAQLSPEQVNMMRRREAPDNAIKSRSAVCILREEGGSGVSGTVHFQQQAPGQPTRITARIKGLKEGKHGFHIHQFGDLTDGCKTAGPHFNPNNKQHGAPTAAERHVGDLGNLEADSKGEATFDWSDPQIKLSGALSVLGRSIVVHADPDDLGLGSHSDSLTTGHSGSRIACGVIALSKE